MIQQFFKENKVVLATTLTITILFPFIILVPSPIGFIPHDVGLQIVGYGGSIIGGFLTLYGVWWTIKRQDEQRREDLAIQYKPFVEFTNAIISLKESCPYDVIQFKIKKGFSEEYTKLLESHNLRQCFFKISNLGRGMLCNFNLKNLSIQNSIFQNTIYFEPQILSPIVEDSSLYLEVKLPCALYLEENIETDNTSLQLFFEFEATDEFTYNKFKITFFVDINVSLSRSHGENKSIVFARYRITEPLEFHMENI